MNPLAPLTLWVLITFLATVVTIGLPLLLGLLNYRRASRQGQQQDIATLVAPIIEAKIAIHNADPFAHPAALQGVPSMEQVRSLGEKLDAFAATMDRNESQRREDVRQFRDDMKELKQNVSRAVGRRSTDVENS